MFPQTGVLDANVSDFISICPTLFLLKGVITYMCRDGSNICSLATMQCAPYFKIHMLNKLILHLCQLSFRGVIVSKYRLSHYRIYPTVKGSQLQ